MPSREFFLSGNHTGWKLSALRKFHLCKWVHVPTATCHQRAALLVVLDTHCCHLQHLYQWNPSSEREKNVMPQNLWKNMVKDSSTKSGTFLPWKLQNIPDTGRDVRSMRGVRMCITRVTYEKVVQGERRREVWSCNNSFKSKRLSLGPDCMEELCWDHEGTNLGIFWLTWKLKLSGWHWVWWILAWVLCFVQPPVETGWSGVSWSYWV